MSFVFAQDAPKKCDCDPALWKTTNKSDNAVYASYFKTEKERGKYLTHFEFSENNKEGKNFECVLNSAFTYRFNVYLSDKSAKKATLQLFNKEKKLISQKIFESKDNFGFIDFKPESAGEFYYTVVYENEEKGCAIGYLFILL
jgi:hypothetical protein